MELKLGLADFTYFLSRSRGMLTDSELLRKAAEWGLQCVQVSVRKPEDTEPRASLRREAEALSLELVGGGFGPPTVHGLQHDIQAGREMRASVVRHACGPFRLRRPPVPPPRLAEALAEVAEQAESENVTIAIENHQDYSSEELAWVMDKVGSAHIGVCLDTGNSIALLEDPVYTAQTLAPFTHAVHLKEYLVMPAEHGIDLVGTPLGTGVVDNKAIVDIVRAKAPADVLYVTIENPLERCAVPILSPEFVEDFATTPVGDLGAVVSLVTKSKEKHPDPVLLPQERGLSDEQIAAEEEGCNRQAVDYCRATLGL